MIQIDSKLDPELLSKLGPRATYGQAMLSVAERFPNVVVATADLGGSSGLDRFSKSYPDRFINLGIAEQNMVGVAAGIAGEGFNVFASSFAPFITMRAAEQVRMNLGYMQKNVKLVGIGSGLSMGYLGNSHFGLEDLAIMRSLPGMRIVCPSDGVDILRTIEDACHYEGPMYIRLTGQPNNQVIYGVDSQINFETTDMIREGHGVAILSHGAVLGNVINAAKILDEDDINCSVYNIRTIKPVQTAFLQNIMEKYSHIIVIEEHSKIGGLGTVVADFLSSFTVHPPLYHISLPDTFGPSGSYDFLLSYHGLDTKSIVDGIKVIVSHPPKKID
jgi:transketolase